MVGVSVSGAEGGGGELLVKEKKMLGSSVLSVSLFPESVCCHMLAAKSGDSSAFCLLPTPSLPKGHVTEFS